MLSDTLISHPPCGWLTLVLDPRSLGEARFFTYMEEYPWQCTSQTPPNIPQPPYLIEVDQVYSCEDGGCVSSLANTYCTPLPGVQGVFEDEGGFGCNHRGATLTERQQIYFGADGVQITVRHPGTMPLMASVEVTNSAEVIEYSLLRGNSSDLALIHCERDPRVEGQNANLLNLTRDFFLAFGGSETTPDGKELRKWRILNKTAALGSSDEPNSMFSFWETVPTYAVARTLTDMQSPCSHALTILSTVFQESHLYLHLYCTVCLPDSCSLWS